MIETRRTEPFPIAEVRSFFPSLNVAENGRQRIYLDNPAGTQVPSQVIDAVSNVYLKHNSYTGVFDSYSVEIDELVMRAYEAMACFLGSDDRGEIMIGPNATSLTYQLTRNIAHMFSAGDEIIVTRMDHEGNISPWLQLAEDTGATIRWLPFNRDSWRIESADLDPLLNDRTRLVALNYVSNLSGAINQVSELSRMAKAAGALVFIDGVQYAPHYLVDAPSLGCDFFACSPYKFFGPHLGAIWGRRSTLEQCRSYKTRTVSEELPNRFFMGVQPFELLSGLLGTIDYFEDLGRLAGSAGNRRALIASASRMMESHERNLSELLLELLRQIPGAQLVGPDSGANSQARAPIFSLTFPGTELGDLARTLADSAILFHWGRKFAYEPANFLGLGPTEGFLRIGISHYNTNSEIIRFGECLGRAMPR